MALSLRAVVVFLAAILTVLGKAADVPRPTQGYQIGDPSSGTDIIMPLSVAQCDPVIVYYNISRSGPGGVYVILIPPDGGISVLALYFPLGVGYLDWICNIPTGHSFFAEGYANDQHYIVQPGSSSACLGSVTTTYSYISYFTNFQSYTQNTQSGNFFSTGLQETAIAFPTSSLSTLTVNPDLAVTSTTATSTVSSALSSPPLASSASSSPPVTSSAAVHKSSKAVIAGGVVGGLALVLLTLTAAFIFWRKRRNSHSNAALGSPTVESDPKPYSGLMASQPAPAPATYFSPPLVPSSGPIHTVHLGREFTPNISRTAVPKYNHVPFTTLADDQALTSHPSDTPVTISFSAPTATVPPVPPKPKDLISSYYPPEPSTSASSKNPVANLTSAFDAAGLTAGQPQILLAALNASSANPATPEKTSSPLLSPSVDVQSLTAQPQSPITNDDAEKPPYLLMPDQAH